MSTRMPFVHLYPTLSAHACTVAQYDGGVLLMRRLASASVHGVQVSMAWHKSGSSNVHAALHGVRRCESTVGSETHGSVSPSSGQSDSYCRPLAGHRESDRVTEGARAGVARACGVYSVQYTAVQYTLYSSFQQYSIQYLRVKSLRA